MEKPQKIIRLHDVKDRTGLSRSTIYQFMAQGNFPKQVSLGERSVGWVENEIEGWLSCRIAVSRAQEVEP